MLRRIPTKDKRAIEAATKDASYQARLNASIALRRAGAAAACPAPETSTSEGEVGQTASDGEYFYYCHAPNAWIRVMIEEW